MFRMMDSQGAYLSEAAPRNDAKWGKHFAQGVSDLRSWFASRVEWLDGQWRTDLEAMDLDYALNAENGTLHFSTSSQYPFTGVIKDGRAAAVSGNAGRDSSSSTVSLTLEMQAGETLSFDYRVSSESGYDKFAFSVGGSQKFEKSGEQNWQSYTFTASSAGSYAFVWKYEKDYSVASGSDCAWLDEVVWSGDPGAGATLPGDADGDGEVTVADALLVMRYAMGIISELPCPGNADMDASGSIDISDALLIMRYAMGVDGL